MNNKLDYLKKAKERISRFHRELFHSDLTMICSDLYDCYPDLNATNAEKLSLARRFALIEIDKEINTSSSRLFSKRKVNRLISEKESILKL